MAVSGIQPFISVHDSNGDPVVGAKLYVYEVGTTTLRAIYSDSALSVSLSNPLTGANASDASGNFPRFYMAAGTYKLRAETSASVLIWQFDNIDTGTSAGSGALPIASGGTGATTAAAARANLDVPSNSELSALSTQISTFSNSLQNVINQPGGRLTLTSATPVITTGVTAGTAVYYTPYISTLCPVYDGTQFNLKVFAELTLTLVANHTASSIYDCFIINDSGTVRIVTGPVWNTVTAGAGARGSGAGTTELARLNGIWVNANAMATARNGSSTYSVAASQGTYVGSIYMDGTNGQISCLTAMGQSRKWGVWNCYNRRPIYMRVNDSTATWAYGTATVRSSNNSAANTAAAFCGLAEESIRIEFAQLATVNVSNGINGIGINVTNAIVAESKKGTFGANTNGTGEMFASHIMVPALGLNNVNALESTNGAGVTFNGSGNSMLMTLRYDG